MDGHSLLFSVQACTHTIAYSITLQGKAAVPFDRTTILLSVSTQSTAPLLGTPVYLKPRARSLLQNHEVSRKQVCFMGYVSLSTSKAVTT